MKCLECGFDNRDGAKFCSECRFKFERFCPICQNKIRIESKFCDECGHGLIAVGKIKTIDYKEPQTYAPKHLTDI